MVSSMHTHILRPFSSSSFAFSTTLSASLLFLILLFFTAFILFCVCIYFLPLCLLLLLFASYVNVASCCSSHASHRRDRAMTSHNATLGYLRGPKPPRLRRACPMNHVHTYTSTYISASHLHAFI